MSFSFVVVGFGPIGAFLAIKLALKFPESNVVVVERMSRSQLCAQGRVFYAAHLARSAIESLKRVDVWQHLIDQRARARIDYRIHFNVCGIATTNDSNDADENNDAARVLSFSNKEFQNCFVGQAFVEDELRERCVKLRNVQLLFESQFVNVEGSFVVVQSPTAPTRRIRADYLFGCDGASREVCGFSFIGVKRKRWCVTDVLCKGIEKLVPDMSWFIDASNSKRPGMFVSLYRDHFRFEFLVFEHESDSFDLPQAIRAAQHFLPRRVVERLTAADVVHQRSSTYRMSNKMASSFQRISVGGDGGLSIFLLGDAAHITEPFTGQGISNGFADVEYLCDKFHNLESYDKGRRRALWFKHLCASIVGWLLHLNNRYLLTIVYYLLLLLPQWLKMLFVKLLF